MHYIFSSPLGVFAIDPTLVSILFKVEIQHFGKVFSKMLLKMLFLKYFLALIFYIYAKIFFKLETGLCVYIPHGNSWQRLGAPRNKRPIDSVILDIGVKERLLDDISNFFTSQQW